MNKKIIVFVLAFVSLISTSLFSQSPPQWAWAQNAGSTNQVNSLCTDKQGYVYVTGSFGDSITFGSHTLYNCVPPVNNISPNDIYIVKYDSLGQVIWARSAGGIGADQATGIQAGPFGDIFLTGVVADSLAQFGNLQVNTGNGVGLNVWSMFVARYDQSGNPIWVSVTTSSSDCDPGSIFVDEREHIYVTGNFGGTMTFNNLTLNPVNEHVFLLKLSGSGYGLWGITGGKSVNAKGMDVSVTPTGDVYLAGNFNDSLDFGGSQCLYNNDGDIFAARFNSSGTPVWLKKFGGQYSDWVNAIGSDDDGNFFLSGSFTSPSISFGCSTINSKSTGDIFLTKLDSAGQCVWTNSYGGGCSQDVYDLAMDQAGDVHITGTYMNPQITFGQYTFTHSTGVGVGNEMFVVKVGNNGTVVWARNSRSHNENTAGLSLAVDDFGNIYTAGTYYSSWIKFDSDTVFSQMGGWEAFLTRIRGTAPTTTVFTNGIETYSADMNGLQVFPNPSSQYFTVSFPSGLPATVELIDSFGKQIWKAERVSEQEMKLNLEGFSPGVYMLVTRRDKGVETKKVVLRE